jgi:hypothetical protein
MDKKSLAELTDQVCDLLHSGAVSTTQIEKLVLTSLADGDKLPLLYRLTADAFRLCARARESSDVHGIRFERADKDVQATLPGGRVLSFNRQNTDKGVESWQGAGRFDRKSGTWSASLGEHVVQRIVEFLAADLLKEAMSRTADNKYHFEIHRVLKGESGETGKTHGGNATSVAA